MLCAGLHNNKSLIVLGLSHEGRGMHDLSNFAGGMSEAT